MSTTVSGVPSSWASKPRSATCRNGIATSRSKRRPSAGTPSSRGTSSSRSTSLRAPPTRVTVAGVAQPDRRPRLVRQQRVERGRGVQRGSMARDSTDPERARLSASTQWRRVPGGCPADRGRGGRHEDRVDRAAARPRRHRRRRDLVGPPGARRDRPPTTGRCCCSTRWRPYPGTTALDQADEACRNGRVRVLVLATGRRSRDRAGRHRVVEPAHRPGRVADAGREVRRDALLPVDARPGLGHGRPGAVPASARRRPGPGIAGRPRRRLRCASCGARTPRRWRPAGPCPETKVAAGSRGRVAVQRRARLRQDRAYVRRPPLGLRRADGPCRGRRADPGGSRRGRSWTTSRPPSERGGAARAHPAGARRPRPARERDRAGAEHAEQEVEAARAAPRRARRPGVLLCVHRCSPPSGNLVPVPTVAAGPHRRRGPLAEVTEREPQASKPLDPGHADGAGTDQAARTRRAKARSRALSDRSAAVRTGLVSRRVGAVLVDPEPVAVRGPPQVHTRDGLVVSPAAAVGLDPVGEPGQRSEVLDPGLARWTTPVRCDVGDRVVEVRLTGRVREGNTDEGRLSLSASRIESAGLRRRRPAAAHAGPAPAGR